jgi:hypothetical protein
MQVAQVLAAPVAVLPNFQCFIQLHPSSFRQQTLLVKP